MDKAKLQSLFDMSGRVVIVTGGTRGIGRAIAEGFAAAGREGRGREPQGRGVRGDGAPPARDGREALGVPTHLGELDALRALVERTVDAFGAIDVMVNNAANALTLPLGRHSRPRRGRSRSA